MTREEIERHVAEYLARGNKIEVVPIQERTVQTIKRSREEHIRYMNRTGQSYLGNK